jgi:hypothetical protein
MVVLVPVPVVVVPPGVLVNVQVPVEGKPFSTTLPVESTQVGCVMVPIVGAVGVPGAAITTSSDGGEVHPATVVTVKLYVPAVSPVKVVLVLLSVTPPGLIVQL